MIGGCPCEIHAAQQYLGDAIYVVGDFNDWCHACHPLQRDREGHWTIAVDLGLGRACQFRCQRDGSAWLNNGQAGACESSAYGSDNV